MQVLYNPSSLFIILKEKAPSIPGHKFKNAPGPLDCCSGLVNGAIFTAQ